MHDQRVQQPPPPLLLLGGQVGQRGRLRLPELCGQAAQGPAVAGAPGPAPLLEPVEHLHHGQRCQAAQVDLAGHRDRLGPLVPPPGIQPGISGKSGLPPASVQGAAGLLAPAAGLPLPKASRHRALAVRDPRGGALPPGGSLQSQAFAVPPDQPVLGLRRQHPRHRVPPRPPPGTPGPARPPASPPAAPRQRSRHPAPPPGTRPRGLPR